MRRSTRLQTHDKKHDDVGQTRLLVRQTRDCVYGWAVTKPPAPELGKHFESTFKNMSLLVSLQSNIYQKWQIIWQLMVVLDTINSAYTTSEAVLDT